MMKKYYNDFKFTEFKDSNKETVCNLIIYDLLARIESYIDKAIEDYFHEKYKNIEPNKGLRRIIINNCCDNIEYIFSEINFFINLFETNNIKVEAKRHYLNRLERYKEDWRNLFKNKRTDWNWYEYRFLTEDELNMQKIKNKGLENISLDVVNEMV